MDSSNDVAIVGMGIRCPGALGPDEFWANMRDGIESVQWLTDKELLEAGVTATELANPNYVKAGAFLDGIADFDAEFFGLSPKEAAIMDPQHRQFLEVCWEALEHAGHPPSKFSGPIGVFGGCGMGTYMMYNLMTNRELIESIGYFAVRHTGNDKDFLTNRVSYCFDLRGPSISVQTACSTSLVATHLAVQSLLLGECDLALAGGVTIEFPHRQGYLYREREILSRDGHCRAFDHRSEGTIFGSGAAVVALRRMDDALRDHDEIYAVIKGSAINNDGASKAGYFAPSVDGQAQAVVEALAVAGVSAETIDLLEAHGTGTPIGDPIEIIALTQAFRATTAGRGFCGIGSVKTNIGHLDTAAGVAGLIKAALALKHRQMPPSLNWEAPNPAIDFASSPFYVNHTLRDWPMAGRPRRAAVNSLGVGGTNAHVVLEEAPAPRAASATELADDDRAYLLRVSARTPAALEDNSRRLADYLEAHPRSSLADVEMTLRHGRHDFTHRRVLACRSSHEAITLLRSKDRFRVFSHAAGPSAAAPIFLFPGGGAQRAGMAVGLHHGEPAYREALDRCLEILRERHDLEIGSLLFATPHDARAEVDFERPSRQLPALFAVEYALAKLWMSWGVQPAALLGHSMGENTAACIAGVMSLEDALGLVCLRGELFETLPEGGMISVSASAEKLEPLLGPDLVIALKNAPELCVVSGSLSALGDFSERLVAQGYEAARIPIRTAAHSPMLEPVLRTFRAYLERLKLDAPQIPFLSNLTGTWITDEQATDPQYWTDHLRGTVQFSDSLATVLARFPQSVYIEVGPGAILTSLARLQPAFGNGHHLVTSLRHHDADISDADFFRTALGRIWATGLAFDEARFEDRGRRIALPTYAFQHRRYWVEPGESTTPGVHDVSLPSRLEDFDNWFVEPRWEPSRLPSTLDATLHSWLVFADELRVGEALADQLRSVGHRVVLVRHGDHNSRRSAEEYLVDSDRGAEGFELLVAGLSQDGRLPDRILSLWTLTGAEAFRTSLNRFAHNLERSFYSLFYLLRALAQQAALANVHIITVSNGARQVTNELLPDPEKATQDGPCRVATHEYEGVTCKSVDVDYHEHAPRHPTLSTRRPVRSADLQRVVHQLRQEILEPAGNSTIAYRGRSRFQLRYERSAQATIIEEPVASVRDGGTYLITGGLGGLGLVVAESLARKAKVNLLLIGRSGLPPRDEWAAYVAQHHDKLSQTIRRVQRLETLGANLLVGAVDITDQEELGQFVQHAESRFGPIHGVIHAAGVVNDRLIAMKTIAEVENVFAPKIYGTLVLDMMFERHALDFFVVFSSSSTITAPAGQADYVAANAFLNAFVHSRSHRKHQRMLAINWGVWNEVGMAAEATRHADVAAVPAKHLLLRERRDTPTGTTISLPPLSTASQWLLDEHRLRDGRPLLPGTAYIEFAAIAAAELAPAPCREIRDLEFICPLAVAEGETKRARIRLQPDDNTCSFELQSWHEAANGVHGWLTHARGQVGAIPAMDLSTIDIEEIRHRCQPSVTATAGDRLPLAQERHVLFGPRWQVLRELRYGDGEALARLELSESFATDLNLHPLHPALLDIATGCAMRLIEGYDPDDSVLWAPAAYHRIAIHGLLPARVFSWIRQGHAHGSGNDRASFDIVITDASGRVVMEIDGFVLQKTHGHDLLAALSNVPSTALETDRSAASSDGDERDLDPATRALVRNVGQGILPEEGMRAFERVIAGCTAREVVVSSLDLTVLSEQASLLTAMKPTPGIEFERPALGNEYVEPSSDDERTMVEFWKELLGVAEVGIQDSFFDLGGHSLIAARLFTKIKRAWGVSLPVGTLLEAPTIVQLIERITEANNSGVPRPAGKAQDADGPPSASWTSLVAIRKEGCRPPIFCVAGKGGNPLNLRHLAARLGDKQPFYGIQHQGVDGLLPPHESVESMALACIDDIKQIRPRGPYLLGGFSAGGLVAFEMARALRDRGDEVALLFLLDTWDPSSVHRQQISRWSNHLKLLKHRGPGYVFERAWEFVWRIISRRNRQPRLDSVPLQSTASDWGSLTPQHVTVQAWTKMEERYIARPDVGSGILYRPYRSAAQTDWTSLRVGNQYNGWDRFLLGGIGVVELPGGHSTMCEEPHVRILAKRLSAAVDLALAEPRQRPLAITTVAETFMSMSPNIDA